MTLNDGAAQRQDEGVMILLKPEMLQARVNKMRAPISLKTV
jgi:hypothetical protein